MELKFTPVMFALFTVAELLLGVITNPALVGVIVYVPAARPVKVKFPELLAVTVAVAVPVNFTVAPFPPIPLMVPVMLHGQAEAVTVMLKDCVAVCAGVPESVTCTVNIVVPVVAGVPVICPFDERLSPDGRVVLFASDQL